MSKKNIIILVITIIIVAVIAFVAYYLFVDPNMFNSNASKPRKEVTIQPNYYILKMSGKSDSRIVDFEAGRNLAKDIEYYVIMNKDKRVVETIVKETFNSEERLKEVVEKSTFLKIGCYAPRIDGSTITYNFSHWNGYTEDKVRDSIKNVSNPIYEVI